MITPIRVIERATSENFNAERYLADNPDVARANVEPLKHFLEYGKQEGREQISAEWFDNKIYRDQKAKLFLPVLDVGEDVRRQGFPLRIGNRHFSVSEYESEPANDDFAPFTNEIDSHPDRLYMDLGCGLRRAVRPNCLYVEVYPSRCADVIVDPELPYPIKDNSLDGIGCFAVLEHTRRPWFVISEMKRMLRPGGKVFIVWPFLQPVHGYPNHYYNASRQGLRALFEDNGFSVESLTTEKFQGPDYSIYWLLNEFYRSLSVDRKTQFGSMTIDQLLLELPQSTFWQEMLRDTSDAVLDQLACGNTLYAKKT